MTRGFTRRPKKRGRYRDPRLPTLESDHQKAVALYLDTRRDPPIWMHVPNETGTSHGYGLRRHLKEQGVKSGVPDILIFQQVPGFAGLALEMKAEGKDATPEQEAWLDKFDSIGWATYVAQGSVQAIAWLKGHGI